MGQRVNKTELARVLGVSEAAVRKHVKRGLYKAGKDGLFDAEECKGIWQAGRDPDAVMRGMAGGAAVSNGANGAPPETTWTKARTAHALFKAKREEIELGRLKGDLISKSDAISACLAVVSVVTERLDGAASQIGPRVVGLTAAEATRVAKEIIDQARNEIARMGDAIETLSDTAKAAA